MVMNLTSVSAADVRKLLLLTGPLALVVLVGCSGGPSLTAPASQPASVSRHVPTGPACVAILEPEVLADLPEADRKALAAALDALLTESLAGRKEFVLVDRRLLDKVLDERKALATGAARIAATDVAEPLRPFWSAGVLICSQVDTKSGVALVEAVAAQSGQLLAAVYAKCRSTSAEALLKGIRPKVAAFADTIQSRLAEAPGKKLVEVVGRLDSKLERGQPLVNDAVEAVRARVSLNRGLTLLIPRQPLNTREERLLRVMGLAKPADADATAGFCAAPDETVRVIVAEQLQAGLTFDDTPVRLTIEAAGRSKTFQSTGGTFVSGLKPAMAWLDEQLGTMGAAASAADDAARAQALSRRHLQALADWKMNSTRALQFLPAYVTSRMLTAASRAAHLDPTNEEAAWLVAAFSDALDPNIRTKGDNRRIFRECRRYLNRFPKANADRRMSMMRACADAGMWALPIKAKGRITFEQFLKPPDPDVYAIAGPLFRFYAAWAVGGRRRHGVGHGNAFELYSRLMMRYLIPHIPADKLDEEHRWWSRFYAQQVDKLPAAAKARNGCDIAVPWELLNAAFAARRKDVQALRQKLSAAARKVPRRETLVWGGDRYNPYLVPILLKAAGDPEWDKWDITSEARPETRVTLNQMTTFISRLSPQTPDCWDYSALPTLAGAELAVPASVRDAGFVNRAVYSRSVQALAVAGDDLLLKTPGFPKSSSGIVTRQFVVPLDREHKRLSGDARELAWPEKDRLPGKPLLISHCVTHFNAKWTIWLGTKAHGVARFDKVGGRWQGRWYNSNHGTPTNGATKITACRNGRTEEILVIDQETRRMYRQGRLEFRGSQTMVWTLNPRTGGATLIHNGTKDNDVIGYPAAELADGRKILLEMAGSGLYSPPIDVATIRKITNAHPMCLWNTAPPFTVGRDGAPRIWRLHDETACLTELSARTLAPVPGTSPGKGRRAVVGAAVSGQVSFVLGMIAWWPGADRRAVAADWPARNVVYALGRNDVLWMAFQTDVPWDYCRCLVGYRPAEPGSKRCDEKDLWIGPFYTPGKGLVYGLAPDGQDGLLLSTPGRVLLLSSDELVKQARKAGLVRSTRRWREGYTARAASGNWMSAVPRLIAERQYAQAGKLLEKREAELGPAGGNSEEGLRVLFWKARLLAEQKERLKEAIALYDRAATHGRAGLAGEAFARANQIILLHKAGRWAKLLGLAGRVQARFPQIRATGADCGMGWYIDHARKKLAAQGSPASTTERQQ